MEVISTVIGYPYIGENRQWKRTVEKFWKGNLSEEQFQKDLKEQRLKNIQRQHELGIDYITVGDFTLYDRMLDLAFMFGLVPERYQSLVNETEFTRYYAMARGAKNVVACEMTKWFNTNYHYIVPEYEGTRLKLTHNKIVDYFLEAKNELNIITKPTLIGPYTFIDLTKGYDQKSRATFIFQLLPLYADVIQQLVDAGAEWIQLEEPSLTKSLPEDEVRLVEEMYKQLSESVPAAKIMLQTYFEALTSYERLSQLPVAGIGLDFVHGKKENMDSIRKYGFPSEKFIGIGCINGRDIWSANLAEVVSDIQSVLSLSGAQSVWIESSCSLQHVPVTTISEKQLDPVLLNALAFADEKIKEIVHVSTYISSQHWLEEKVVSKSMLAIEALSTHSARHNKNIHASLQSITETDFSRALPYEERRTIQKQVLQLPDFPTTTIGSFPQSAEVKKTRAAWRKNQMTDNEYAAFIKKETARWVEIQEDIGLDVFVHGEFERTDMVEFFGEKLSGLLSQQMLGLSHTVLDV